jgi:hypothetical protein
LDKSFAKAKFFQCVQDVRVFHAVICRGLVKGYDCKWQIVLVGMVCGVSDEMGVGLNGSVWYAVTLIGGDEVWEH